MDEEPFEDDSFDASLALRLQAKAPLHFTPIDVAQRAARLFALEPRETVLDVGSGAGKFCLAAARAVPHARFVGVEWRHDLVAEAKRLAGKYRLTNVDFIEADAIDLDWSEFDAFYLYNPFAEHLLHHSLNIDASIPTSPERFIFSVAAARRSMARARRGARVVTYHGFGDVPPIQYRLVRREAAGSAALDLWLKVSDEAIDVKG